MTGTLMTITLKLPEDLEKRLRAMADQRGLSIEQSALQLLQQHLPMMSRQERAISLLQSWIDDTDDQEQKETGEYLIRSLDEDRSSDRKLFPPELKGTTW